MDEDPRSLVEPLRALAVEAGNRILEVYRREDFEEQTKADNTPLTLADEEAHRCIDAGLQRIAPEIPRLSEEGQPEAASVRRGWSRYWLIDPLDGTREFIKRNGEFTVNIALVEGGRPVLGVVHAPVLETSWVGVAGGGAHRYEGDEVRPIATRAFPDEPVVVVSRSHRDAATERILERLPRRRELSVGSSLKICRVAEGTADVYPRFGPTSEWDTGAAQAVLESAGGLLITPDLERLRYNNGDGLLNPDFVAGGDPEYDWATLLRDLPWERRR